MKIEFQLIKCAGRDVTLPISCGVIMVFVGVDRRVFAMNLLPSILLA